MERLTIDEVIERCKRKTAKYENLNGINTLETADISFSFVKEYWEHRQVKEYLEELKRYRDLEEQGLLLRLPCKVGDSVYSVIEDGLTIVELKFSLDFYERRKNDFGKTVFLTKVEAEQKLKELRGE